MGGVKIVLFVSISNNVTIASFGFFTVKKTTFGAETSYFLLMYSFKWSLNLIKWFSQKCGFKADLDARIYEISRIWLYSVVQMC